MSDEIRFGISELADAAGVSVRTVRYYITEGLLPPPVTAGAKSYYTGDHCDRLIVIGRLKDAYLPLREIRRQLSEMDDLSIHEMAESALATEHDVAEIPIPGEHALPSKMSLETSGFIAGREDIRPSSPVRSARPRDSASEYISRVLKRAPDRRAPGPAPLPSPKPAPASPSIGEDSPAHYGTAPEPPSWRRIAISDDAELLISEETYLRRRDKVNWLVDWAKKVLG